MAQVTTREHILCIGENIIRQQHMTGVTSRGTCGNADHVDEKLPKRTGMAFPLLKCLRTPKCTRYCRILRIRSQNFSGSDTPPRTPASARGAWTTISAWLASVPIVPLLPNDHWHTIVTVNVFADKLQREWKHQGNRAKTKPFTTFVQANPKRFQNSNLMPDFQHSVSVAVAVAKYVRITSICKNSVRTPQLT